MRQRFKRAVSLMLVFVMVMTLMPAVAKKETAQAATTYNASAAVAYAQAHCWDTPQYDADCANFVSQCLRAGGLTDTYYPYGPNLLSYLQGLGFQVIDNPSYSQINYGDVIFFSRSGNSSRDCSHTVICVGFNSAGMPLVASHTTPRWAYKLSNYFGYYSKLFCVVHVGKEGTSTRPIIAEGVSYGGSGSTNVGGSLQSNSTNPDDHAIPTTCLRKNSTGDSVAWVQAMCNRLAGTALNVDGIYGNNTINAVKVFQRNNGLTVDGIVGVNTRSKMIERWNATKVVNPSSVSISSTSLDATVGYTEQLSANVGPDNATDKSVSWSSSNDSVVSVSNGTVTPKSEGTATITVSTSNGVKASCSVRVHKENVIKFIDYDGSVLSEQKVKYGGSANAPENPTRKGYTFKGWDGKYQNVSADAEVTAIYTKNVYKVTFMETNGTKIGNVQEVEYEGAATAPDESSLTIPDGYTFKGWSDTFDYIESDLTVYPVYEWSDDELPMVISADETSCIGDADEGTYKLNFSIVNHSSVKKKARVMTYMITDSGRMVAQGETRTVKVPAAKDGTDGVLEVKDMYIVCDKAADKVRVVVLDDYESAVPLAEIKDIDVDVSGYSDWSDDKPTSESNEYQTRTMYRSKNVNYITSSSSTLAGWTKYDTKSTTSTYGAGDSVWYGEGKSGSAPANGNAYRVWSAAKSHTQYNPDAYQFPTQNISLATSGGDSYRSQVRWIQTALCRLGYITGIDGVYGTNTKSVVVTFQRNNGLSADGIVGSSTRTKLRDCINAKNDYDYYYETKKTQTNYTYYFYQEDSNWSDWRDTEISGDTKLNVGSTKTLVETKTEYRYKIDFAEAGTAAATMTPECSLPDEAMSLAGKEAVVIVFKNKVNQIAEDNVEYIGDTTIGTDGSLDISFVPREVQTYEGTGDYTIVLGIKGTTNYIKVGTIEAPKPVYNVTFVDSDGNAIPIDADAKTTSQEISEGGNAVVPEAPEKEGYRFIGWDMGATNIHADTTITAQYAKDTCTVTYVDWENRSIETKSVEYGETLTFPENTPEAPEGLEFKGWNVDGTLVQSILSSTEEKTSGATDTEIEVSKGITVTKNLLCEAVFEKPVYKVTFVDGNGDVVSEQEVEYGDAAMAPAVVQDPESLIDAELKDTLTVDDVADEVLTAEDYPDPTVPEKVDNMKFVSWGEDIDLTSITSNLVVGAIYEYNETVDVPYASVESGEYDETQSVELKCDTEDAIIYYTTDGSDPTDVTENSENINTYSEPIKVSDSMVLKYYACKMGCNDSSVSDSWYSINTTGNTPTHVIQIVSVNTFDSTVVSGYKGFAKDSETINAYELLGNSDSYDTVELEGIYYDADMTDKWQEGSETVVESLTLYAKYIGKRFTVTYLDEDGTEIATGKVSYGQAVDDSVAPTKDGYVFAGWINDEQDVNSVTSDMTVTAKYISSDEYVSIKFPRSTYSIMAGSTYKLTPKLTYTSGEKAANESVIWTVSDENYASIDEDGNVSTLAKGEITVTAKVVSSGAVATCTVKITGNPDTSICLLSNSSYKIVDGYLRDIDIDRNTVAEVKKQINADSLKFIDSGNTELQDTDRVGTGTRIQLLDENGGMLDEVTVIYIGDYNGDGVINGKDVSGLIRCLIGKEAADSTVLRALDLNGDGNVNNRDAAMLSRYLVGKEEL